jgi:protein SDA1
MHALISLLQILTPADFALLNDLRLQAARKSVEVGGGSNAKRKLAALEASRKSAVQSGQQSDTFVSEIDILGPRKKAKSDYAERIASIEKGREGREKFGSYKGKKNKVASSSTNREKARNKPVMMILGSGAVNRKRKVSLREKQQKLRAHMDRSRR